MLKNKTPAPYNSSTKKLLAIAVGLGAGIINGLLGTGGGILIIFASSLLFPSLSKKDIFATSIASILPMSVVSAASYLQNGSFELKDCLIYILPAAVGGIAGAILLDKIKIPLLKKIFAAMVIWAGITMVR